MGITDFLKQKPEVESSRSWIESLPDMGIQMISPGKVTLTIGGREITIEEPSISVVIEAYNGFLTTFQALAKRHPKRYAAENLSKLGDLSVAADVFALPDDAKTLVFSILSSVTGIKASDLASMKLSEFVKLLAAVRAVVDWELIKGFFGGTREGR